MKEERKEKETALTTSVGADVQQSPKNSNINIISENVGSGGKTFPVGKDLNVISMTALFDQVYNPKLPLIEGLLYQGMYLFAGAPKIGKSFFMAQLSYSIAKGITLWQYPVRQGTVLYLALEDDYARIQQRLYQMFGAEECDHLYFATRAKTLSEGLDRQLEDFIKEHSDTRLIIIDTLQKVREIGGERYSYASDYEIVTRLKDFSDRSGICLLAVHHTRKMEAEDTFDMISGTTGLLGAADGAFLLQKKKRTDNTAILNVVGRDQQDQELTLEFDREKCIWKLTKAETELWKPKEEPILSAIGEAITQDNPEWEGTASELLELLSLPTDTATNTITRKLNANVGRLLSEYGIIYEPCQRKAQKRTFRLFLKQSEDAT